MVAMLAAAGPAVAATIARITSPSAARPVLGKVTIEVEVETPPGVATLKIEVFVDGRLLATLLDPPFRAEWEAGDGLDEHVIRVKAYAGDGSSAVAEMRTTPPVGIQHARVLLVEVYATVKDRDGRFITDLKEPDFALSEDGAPQRLSLFTSERKPVTVVLLLDVSASMKREDRLASALAVGRMFVEALEAQDRVSVVVFSDEVKVIEPFTPDRGRALAAIDGLQPERGTALYDAIFAGAGILGKEEGRRALVLLSDGQDLAFDGMGPGSARTFEDAVTETLRHQVIAYTIGLGANLESDFDFNHRHSAEEILTRLASDTGGRFFAVQHPGRLRGAFERVLEELRFQYTLGYHPSNDRRDGTWRGIDVKVTRPRLIVSARKGYFAPTE